LTCSPSWPNGLNITIIIFYKHATSYLSSISYENHQVDSYVFFAPFSISWWHIFDPSNAATKACCICMMSGSNIVLLRTPMFEISSQNKQQGVGGLHRIVLGA
jgi:hypothetical protein